MRGGFSLVELSIVLVILGLLTGGILAGQSLIRAAEIRSVTTDAQRYVVAMQTFRDKYFAIPGDMNNATRFWGDENAVCPDATVANGSPGTCNGDGDGRVFGLAVPYQEEYRSWQHLAFAGLIEGSYTGKISGGSPGTVLGSNVPASRMSNAGWSLAATTTTMYGSWNIETTGNTLFFGAPGGDVTRSPVLLPQEAWSIDTKMDDGFPATGKVLAEYANTSCYAAGTPPSSYMLTTTTKVCSMRFLLQ